MTSEMKDAWTDERLDDLNSRVGRGFDGVDHRFDRLELKLETRIDKVEEKLGKRIDGVEAKIDALGERIDAMGSRIDERFHSLYLALIGGSFILIASLIGLLAAKA
jgi:chromosome segregation ATPase